MPTFKELIQSIKTGDFTKTEEILDEHPELAIKTNKAGNSPLIIATMLPHCTSELVLAMLNANADINAQGKGKTTALHCAALYSKDLSVIETLLKNNADPLEIDGNRMTPLQRTKASLNPGTEESIQLLQQACQDGRGGDTATIQPTANSHP